jgi:2-isopropylmalate synthase
MSEHRIIRIFDTTLRDGEQSPGCSMNLDDKLRIAEALIDLGVDVIEAGFPIASPGDFQSVREVANQFTGATICGLARCNDADIDRAWEALRGADSPRIHVFLATSAIHREFKLKMTPDQIVDTAVRGVRRAIGYCDNVEFSPEDAARTEIDFLCRVVEAVIAAGATTVNIPDTVGYAVPAQMGKVIANLRNRVPNIDRAVLSIHCHNDLGLAVANSLAAVENGAGQIECTINGIGERAGNCSMEEVVMALRTRSDYYQCQTKIETTKLVPISRLLCDVTGMVVQRNKAIVGRNAFAHEAGIHQDGMLKERTTYEIMRPEDVGLSKTDLVLGKHSGRAALADRAKQLGFELTADQIKSVFDKFKELADLQKEIYDGDIAALIEREIQGSAGRQWALHDFDCRIAAEQGVALQLKLQRGSEIRGHDIQRSASAVDAVLAAVNAIVGLSMKCRDVRARNLVQGANSKIEVHLDAEQDGQLVGGRGEGAEWIGALILAAVHCANRLELARRRQMAHANQDA